MFYQDLNENKFTNIKGNIYISFNDLYILYFFFK